MVPVGPGIDPEEDRVAAALRVRATRSSTRVSP